jgi:hypothetical protein
MVEEIAAERPPEVGRGLQLKTTLVALFVALPAVIFYAILFRQLINLPFLDDYDAVLGFLNRMAELHGLAAKFVFF